MSNQASRRRFVRQGLGILMLAPFVASLPAQTLKVTSEDAPPGKTFHYSRDASKSKHPSYKSGSSCSNCQFFKAENNACSLMTGYSTVEAAWCSAWAKKA